MFLVHATNSKPQTYFPVNSLAFFVGLSRCMCRPSLYEIRRPVGFYDFAREVESGNCVCPSHVNQLNQPDIQIPDILNSLNPS